MLRRVLGLGGLFREKGEEGRGSGEGGGSGV